MTPSSWWRRAAIYELYVQSFADGDGDGDAGEGGPLLAPPPRQRNPTDEGRVMSNEPDDVLDFVGDAGR